MRCPSKSDAVARAGCLSPVLSIVER